MPRKMYIFVVFIAICACKYQQFFSTASCSDSSRKEFGPPVYDEMLAGPVLYSFTSNDEVLCQFNCHINDNCDKYNFNNQTHQCEMLDRRLTYAREKRVGWMFKTIECEGDPCNGFLCYVNEGPVCVCTFDWMGKSCEVRAMGMEDRTILNSQITASSFFDTGHEPYQARLNNYPTMPYNPFVASGSWSAKTNQADEYLQINLSRVFRVTMVATQGRPYLFNQWVTRYKLNHKTEGSSGWQDYKEEGIVKDFSGNTDMETVVQHQLSEELRTQFIRFVVLKWNTHISMRVELYGSP